MEGCRLSDEEDIYCRVLEVSQSDESNHPLSIFRRRNLAWSFQEQRKFAQAKDHYTRALKQAKNVFGTEHREVAAILSDAANLQTDQGHFKEASDLYADALGMMRAVHGSLDLKALKDEIYNSLCNSPDGGMLRDTGHNAHEMSGNISVVDHPDTLNVMAGIARLRTKEKRWDDAAEKYDEVYQMRKLILGEEHEDTLDSVDRSCCRSCGAF